MLDVDTTMAHGRTKIVVPVCAVDAVAFVEVHRVGDIGQDRSRGHACRA